MDSDDLGRLVYLGVLAAVLVFWFVLQNRASLGKTLQQAAVWGLIFLGVIAAIGLWEDIRRTVQPGQAVFAEQGRIELPRAPDGHYYVTLNINDAPVRFVIDTGATGLMLTMQDAQRAGIDPADMIFMGQALTANGPVRTAQVDLEQVSLGPFTDRSVPAFVNEGQMPQSLLGMSYLQRYTRLEIADGRLILER